MISSCRPILLLCILVALQACALGPSARHEEQPALSGSSNVAGACRAWLTRLDAVVHSHSVVDAQDQRIDGFLYARTTRFLASWRAELSISDPRFQVWARMLVDRGREGLLLEWARLSPREQQNLMAVSVPGGAKNETGSVRLKRCIDSVTVADLNDDLMRQNLLDRSEAKDAYVDWQRWLGLYPLTRIPFSAGVQRWQADTQATFDAGDTREQVEEGEGQWVHYVPKPSPGPGVEQSRTAVAGPRPASVWPRNVLGIPELSPAELTRLFELHAPVLRIPGHADFDRFGTLRQEGKQGLIVDTGQPTAYTRASHTRWGGHVLLQLNYLFWFPSRPASSRLDLLAGRFDGFIWRVTLDEDGKPLVYDTIHACGCYHEFFPVPDVRRRKVPEEAVGQEWMFSPADAPAWDEGMRVLLRLASRSHYLERVGSLPRGEALRTAAVVHYALVNENRLRSLPPETLDAQPTGPERPGGGAISFYGADGLVPGSERLERFLFWPMGIPSAGAQRQWGHHATAFVGRRHFDDPFLLEERFERRFPGVGAKKKAAPVTERDL